MSKVIMGVCFWFILCLILYFVACGFCWDVLSDMGSRRAGSQYIFKNEYLFGDCKRTDKTLYANVHKTLSEVQEFSVIREWLHIKRLPTCIILRAATYESDTYRVTKYNFVICVPRLTFCYKQRRFNYYYYEWYIPPDVAGGLDWDIYFYGPPGEDWVLT